MHPLIPASLRLGAVVIGAVLAAPLASAQYTYGRYLEPPDGSILQGMGQFWGPSTDNQQYLDALAPYGEGVMPGHDMFIVNISPSAIDDGHFGTFDAHAQTVLLSQLQESADAQRIPHVAISFLNYNAHFLPGMGQHKPTAHDIDVADDDAPMHDFMLNQITLVGQTLAAFGQPVFVRIGLEFNNPSVVDGAEGYHAFYFPIAYRKTVKALEAAGAERCAYIWCWQASAPTTYADVDPVTGLAAWYPGDEYVDWFGLDIFNRNQFTTLPSPIYPLAASQLPDVEQFLAFAENRSRPVFVAESACVDYDIVAGDANDSLVNWFLPFFTFIANHPSIKAVTYISHDWTGGSGGAPLWKDSRIANSSQVTFAWAHVMGLSAFIGKRSGPFLNGYDGWWGLGNSLPGAKGDPLLRGFGALHPGQPVTLELTNAKPHTLAALFVGFSAIDLPFKGGVMVPKPEIVVDGLHTDETGHLTLMTTWPDQVPSGFRTYYQCWIADATQPLGLAASNALLGESL